MKKYFTSRKEAMAAAKERNTECFKMPKGTRHAGKYAVCSRLEYLNTY